MQKDEKSPKYPIRRNIFFQRFLIKEKFHQNSHSRRIWWKKLGKICFSLKNSRFLSSSSLRFATQIQQKRREHILMGDTITPLLNHPMFPSTAQGTCVTAEHGFCHHISATKRELWHFINKPEGAYGNVFPCLTALGMQAGGFGFCFYFSSSHSSHCPSSQGLWGTFHTQEPLSHHPKPSQIPGTSC